MQIWLITYLQHTVVRVGILGKPDFSATSGSRPECAASLILALPSSSTSGRPASRTVWSTVSTAKSKNLCKVDHVLEPVLVLHLPCF